MLLEKIENNKLKESFLVLAAALGVDERLLLSYTKEAGFGYCEKPAYIAVQAARLATNPALADKFKNYLNKTEEEVAPSIIQKGKELAELYDDDRAEFIEKLDDMIEGIDIYFYLDISTVINSTPKSNLSQYVSEHLKQALNASEDVISLCDNWALVMGVLARNASDMIR